MRLDRPRKTKIDSFREATGTPTVSSRLAFGVEFKSYYNAKFSEIDIFKDSRQTM